MGKSDGIGIDNMLVVFAGIEQQVGIKKSPFTGKFKDFSVAMETGSGGIVAAYDLGNVRKRLEMGEYP